jgi:hypothetical protein
MAAAVIGVLIGLTAAVAFAQPPTITLDVPVSSDYVWRGQVYDDEPVIQPSLAMEVDGFGLEYWQNYSTKDDVLNEYNITASYTREFGPVSLSLGLINFDYPNTADPSTQEVFIGLEMEGLISTFITAYYDINETEALYAELGASYSYQLVDKVSIELAVSMGVGDEAYSEYWFYMPDARLQDGNVRLSIPWELTDQLKITFSEQFTTMLDFDIHNDAIDSECWITAVGLTYTL